MDRINTSLYLVKIAGKLDQVNLPRCSDRVLRIAQQMLEMSGDSAPGGSYPLGGMLPSQDHSLLRQSPSTEGFAPKAKQISQSLFNLRNTVYNSARTCILEDTSNSPQAMAGVCLQHLMGETAQDLQILGKEVIQVFYQKVYQVYQAALQAKAGVGTPEKLEDLAEATANRAVDALDDIAGDLFTPDPTAPN